MNLSQLKVLSLAMHLSLIFSFYYFFRSFMLIVGTGIYDSRLLYGGSLIEFKQDLYLIIGIYKMIWFFFNVIPYWVVRGMEKDA